jgi:penicillin-binding protein 1A
MKKCYEDKDLQISKEEFENPNNQLIKVDCWTLQKLQVASRDSTDVEEQTD